MLGCCNVGITIVRSLELTAVRIQTLTLARTQTLLQILATIVHGEALSHLFFNLDHVVQDFNRKILITLEIDSWILSTVKICLTESSPTLLRQLSR